MSLASGEVDEPLGDEPLGDEPPVDMANAGAKRLGDVQIDKIGSEGKQ